MYVFPNTSILVSSTFVQISVLHPNVPGSHSPEAIMEIFGYLIGDEAVEQAREGLTAALRELAVQDIDIMNRQQVGRGGDVSDEGHMINHWDGLQAALFKRIAECYNDQ